MTIHGFLETISKTIHRFLETISKTIYGFLKTISKTIYGFFWIPYQRSYMICSNHINDDDQINAEESGVNGFLETMSKTIYGFLDTIARSYTKSMLFVYGTLYGLGYGF